MLHLHSTSRVLGLVDVFELGLFKKMTRFPGVDNLKVSI